MEEEWEKPLERQPRRVRGFVQPEVYQDFRGLPHWSCGRICLLQKQLEDRRWGLVQSLCSGSLSWAA